MSEEKKIEAPAPVPVQPDAPLVSTQEDRSYKKSAPNLKWPATTFILGGIVSYYIFLADNWGATETFMILGSLVLICAGSIIAIFYERDERPLFGVLHRAYLLYGAFLLIGSALAAVTLGFGNVLVPLVFPFNLAPFSFYALLATLLVLSVEFGLSIVKNFRK